MYNSITNPDTLLNSNKRALANFISQICQGLEQNKKRFYADMSLGILSSGKVIISQIAAHLLKGQGSRRESIAKRLYRNLDDKIAISLKTAFFDSMVDYLPKEPLILMDDSDVIKPEAKAFEALGYVRDGSTGEIEKGYWMQSIVGISSTSKQPLPLGQSIFSTSQEGFKSTNREAYNLLLPVMAKVQEQAIFVFDRAYDHNGLYQKFFSSETNPHHHHFLCRIKANRNFIVNGKEMAVKDIWPKYKGKYRVQMSKWNSRKSQRIQYQSRASCVEVYLPAIPKHKLWLVMVFSSNFDQPMLLLTNRPMSGKETIVKLIHTYNMRWRIEEYFRFQKQSCGLEDFRVRSLHRIQHLLFILNIVVGWLGILSEKAEMQVAYAMGARQYCDAIRETVYFHYYRLQEGLAMMFNQAKTTLDKYFPKQKRPREFVQLNFI